MGYITPTICGSPSRSESNGLHPPLPSGGPGMGSNQTGHLTLGVLGWQVGRNQPSFKTGKLLGPRVGGVETGFITLAVSESPSEEECNGLHHACRVRPQGGGGIKWAS